MKLVDPWVDSKADLRVQSSALRTEQTWDELADRWGTVRVGL